MDYVRVCVRGAAGPLHGLAAGGSSTATAEWQGIMNGNYGGGGRSSLTSLQFGKRRRLSSNSGAGAAEPCGALGGGNLAGRGLRGNGKSVEWVAADQPIILSMARCVDQSLAHLR